MAASRTMTDFLAQGPNQPLSNCITFAAPATEEVMRIDKEGFHYRGQFIADAGVAHRLMLEFLKQNTRAALAQPEPVAPTDEEIDALVICIQGLPAPDADGLALPSIDRGRDMVRKALARWGHPTSEENLDD
jgi:hypothetical protein